MQTIDFSTPLVMGILNVTPDSFFDGGKHLSVDAALAQTTKMLDEGAKIIDIGGYSSRPNAEHISESEELRRVIPVVKELKNAFPKAIFSIDTFRSKVAEKALCEGATIINDISGGLADTQLMKTVAEANAYYVLMHMRGTPQTMQTLTNYTTNVVTEVLNELKQQVEKFTGDRSKVIADPGFGFAKTLDQNYELLKHLDYFKTLACPILVGLSRKSMIYKKLNTTPEKALNGTSVLHTIALQKGANILRAHDVKEAIETINLVSLIN